LVRSQEADSESAGSCVFAQASAIIVPRGPSATAEQSLWGYMVK